MTDDDGFDSAAFAAEATGETTTEQHAAAEGTDPSDDPVDVDDLPDRFVPVEDYVERKSRREDVDGDRLARRLEDYDVVDVESYTGEHIEAYTLEEVV